MSRTLIISNTFQAFQLLTAEGKRENKNRRRDTEKLELLEGAENGRYKVVAKAEPYKNLPVNKEIDIVLITVRKVKTNNYLQPAPVTPGDFYPATPAPPKDAKSAFVTGSHRLIPSSQLITISCCNFQEIRANTSRRGIKIRTPKRRKNAEICAGETNAGIPRDHSLVQCHTPGHRV